MVGVTCEKCGATYRFDDAEVPPSGKIIKCTRCGQSVTVMPAGAEAMGMRTQGSPAAPLKATVFGVGPGQSPARVPAPGQKVPAPARAVPPTDEVAASWDALSDGDLIALGEAGPGPSAAPAKPAYRKPAVDDDMDLVAPVGPLPTKQVPDLLAPVGPRPSAKKQPGRLGEISDLPAPVGPVPTKQVPDLLAPVGPVPTKHMPDLLTPVGPTPTRRGPAAEVTDLPTPVGPVPTRQLPDLLTPVGPAPTKGIDLPAPKGFFDDGVQPKNPSSGPDLPAPKGFFDDGVQPRSAGGYAHEPAPLPLGAKPAAPAGRTISGASKPAPATTPPPARTVAGTGKPAPLPVSRPSDKGGGFVPFDTEDSIDIGDPFSPSSSGPSRPFGLDTGDLEFTIEPTGNSAPSVPLGLDGPLGGSTDIELEPSRGNVTDAIELDLGGPSTAEAPTAGSVVTFGKPAAKPGTAAFAPPKGGAGPLDPFAPTKDGVRPTMELGLDLDRPSPPASKVAAPKAAALEVARQVPKRAPARKADAAGGKKPGRGRTLILVSALGAVALGAGGYFGWTWWQGSQTRKESSSRGLKKAEALLADDASGHWEKAAAEAQRVLGGDKDNTEALAIVAEANFAAALDENFDVAARTEKANAAIEKLRKTQAKGPHALKAEALSAILSTSFEAAIKKLDPLRDGDAKLYAGWALAAHEQHEKAVQAFTAALAKRAKRIPAFYGLGLAQLELGARDAAQKAFQSAIDQSRDRFKRDHLGALIGLAQLAPVGERESRYQELLNRADLDKAPPRAVSRLRTLAGDEAVRAGRLDQAKSLYEEARGLDQLNLRAQVGLAILAMRTGDLSGARKRLSDVLEVAPGHIEAALALSDLAVAEGKHDEALKVAEGLFSRTPAIANPLLVARAHLARARVYEASADRAIQEKAEAEYREAMTRADPGDFTAAVRLSILLTRLGKAKDAVEVLGPVKAAAQKDPDLSITLGGAYLAAGNGAAAVDAFENALARRPDDLEARFQLGQAQFVQGKHDAAIETLRRALDKDASREDIGLALARMLASRGRGKDAAAVFEKLLAGKPSIAVRARAGRFFAREGLHEAAMAQGEAIRGENPRHPVALFLLGEKLQAEKKYEEAQKAYRDATRLEPEAQYFEALARAAEKLGQLDEALRQFSRAVEIDPLYLPPRLGRGRVRLVRREYSLAIDELKAAQELAPDNAAVVRDLGRAHLAMRDVKAAVPLLARATTLAPSDADAHFSLGQAYFDLDRARDAAGHLGRAIQHGAPDASWRGEAYRMLGYALRTANNNRGAIDAWRKYLEIDTRDSAHRRDVQRLLLRLEAR
jgi:predicted Zn finger-like uncharacterized protein